MREASVKTGAQGRNRLTQLTSRLTLLTLVGAFTGTAQAGIDDLAWMTGSWAGPAGPDVTLEENWTQPKAGSIGAWVRMYGPDGTAMVEFIVIEEKDDSLVLHLQQWGPGYEPRPGSPQTMELVTQEDSLVRFKAVTPGGLAGLSYSREGSTFTVGVETADGNSFPIVLEAL
ncbi:MAG: DUF6265 family protein [Pseudomonadota bacterium]